jgi:hypothetical protein
MGRVPGLEGRLLAFRGSLFAVRQDRQSAVGANCEERIAKSKSCLSALLPELWENSQRELLCIPEGVHWRWR